MEKLLPSIGEFEKEWVLEFHGVSYEINLGTSSSVLTLDIEQEGTNDKWSAEFTSQYIEEITHKAGNFKKFDTFVMMLSSAFARESDTVYVDLLTYNDLEMMKARKVGGAGAGGVSTNSSFQSQNSSTSRSQMKRYVILTYNSEFDRVHFPLPLSYEENPTVESLQRTIFRLKRRERERTDKEKDQLVSVKESRDLKFIDAQLRQENTELRHRLRLKESKGLTKGGADDSFSSAESLKLKKQVDQLKRALLEKCASYDRLKADALSMRPMPSDEAGSRVTNRDLQSKVRQLQSMLEMERLDHRKEVTRLKKELSDSRRSSMYGTSRSGSSVNRSNTSRERDSNTRSSRASVVTRSRSPLGNPSPPPRQRRSSAQTTRSTTGSSRTQSRTTTRGYGESSGYGQNRRSSSGSDSRAGTTRTTRSTYSRSPTAAPRNASRSRSPSSSLGGVFDPTAYAREKAEKKNKLSESRGRAWGAGGSARDRYSRESGYNSASSGYNSATSQSSGGSARSRRSTGSARSVSSKRSVNSGDSRGREKDASPTPKKTKKAAKSKSTKNTSVSNESKSRSKSKSKSPSRKRKTKRDNFRNPVGIGIKDGNGLLDERMSSSALDLHQSETLYSHHPEDVHQVLGQYLQAHDDSDAERMQREQSNHQRMRHQQSSHREHQEIVEVHSETMVYHSQQPPRHQEQHVQFQESSFSSNGRPPLRSSPQSAPQRTSYPIDDIEDDSDETDSNLDSGSEQGEDYENNTKDTHEAFLDRSAVTHGRVNETDEISNLRSHLLQSVSPSAQEPNHSLATSTTSVKSFHSDHRQSTESLRHSKDDNVVRDSLEKENHPNSVAATPSPSHSIGAGNDRKMKFSPGNDDGDVSDIDRRLSDLQKFLDKARSGILAVAENTDNTDADQS